MAYADTFQLLKSLFDQSADTVEIPGHSVRMVNCTFHSTGETVLPGARRYLCDTHGVEFLEADPAGQEDSFSWNVEGLAVADVRSRNNSEFRYTIFKHKREEKSHSVILLLHGLNERYWNKYLPWALRLVELTGSSVCLVPIAFHMNRAPAEWSSPKLMKAVARDRQIRFPSVVSSSFANAAISTRLQSIPQRFVWSGVQTYNDIIQLVQEIRCGAHPHIAENARIDAFAYSVGSFLAEIMFMSNRDGLFSDSRLFMFCGGPTFDRMYPVSKYIIDSEALICLYSFFVEHLENECKRDRRLAHYFHEGHTSGLYFRSMLSNRRLKEVREKRLREISSRLMAVAVKQDEVVQPSEVLNTLNGDFRDIPVPVRILDFPCRCSHVNPFPVQKADPDEVNRSFDQVFDLASSHLGR